MSLRARNTIFRPIISAGVITIVFGGICLWISQIIQLKEEGEGFTIIGWRFIIGGIAAIAFAFILRYFVYIRPIRKRSKKFDDLYKP
jgi:hypothetical protein